MARSRAESSSSIGASLEIVRMLSTVSGRDSPAGGTPRSVFTESGPRAWLRDVQGDSCRLTGRTPLGPAKRARAELPQVLVGEHEPEVVAPSFHQHVIEALGQVQVVLELVQVEVEIGPLGLRLRCSGEDCLP